jgi:hypothetical protein
MPDLDPATVFALRFNALGAPHVCDIRGMFAVTDVDRAFLENEIAQRGLTNVSRECI